MSITDRRGHQLGFCTVCIHRKISPDRVVSCKLTNEIANFESECPSFTLDLPTLLKRRITQEKHVLDRYDPARHLVEKLLYSSNNELIKKEKLNSSFYKSTTKTIFRESDQSDLSTLVVSVIVIFISFIYYILNTDQPIAMLIAFVAFLSSCFFGYRLWTYDYKVKLKITNDGLQTPTETIFWSNVMEYYLFEKKESRNESLYTLVILTASGTIKTIPLNYLNVDPYAIVKKINWQRKVYYHDTY